VIDAISGAFESSKTEVTQVAVPATYSYTTSLSGGTLTINNANAAELSLAVVRDAATNTNYLLVDAPDTTASVVVAQSKYYTRSFDASGWPWEWGWTSWHLQSTTDIYRTVTFSNMTKFAASGVSKIVINGTNSAETIIEDRASVSISTDVHGNGGNDVIVTGKGNDRVWGGSGDDTIFTYEGNDELYGEDGNDKLTGGTGNDWLDGGNGNDYLDENAGKASPEVATSETNTMIGGSGNDIIVGSPGKDTIEGGDGNDTLMGLTSDDTYVFKNGYGTDKLVDYHGVETLDFGSATANLTLTMSADFNAAFTADAGSGNHLVIDGLLHVGTVELGTGTDHFSITQLPFNQLNITDAGGTDTYDFDLDKTDVAQDPARVDIVDNGGTSDHIALDVDSTSFDIYLHPQAVLLNRLNLTFNPGVEELHLTDHAADSTITTAPAGPGALLIKTSVTITQATGGDIKVNARGDFTQQAGSLIETAGDVVVRAGVAVVAPPGVAITLFGTINANHVTVYGSGQNDTVAISQVASATDVYAGDGNDTINVGTPAPGTVDGIGNDLKLHGEGGSDTLNVDDTGDGNANMGTLTPTMIKGLDMASGGITYDSFATLTIGLGTAGDTFTIEGTHAGTTTVNGNNGNDTITIEAISGPTTANGGNDSDTFYVGANVGTVNDIAASLTLNGNDPTSGSDSLFVDDTGDTTNNTGTLTSSQITGLGMAVGITYGTIEHLTISLGSGNDTFTISSTHGAATSPFQEDTTLNAGAGSDTVAINNVTDKLVVSGQADADTITVSSTGTGSISTLSGGLGNDVFNLRAMNGTVDVNGGDDNDTINVGSAAPQVPAAPTNKVGTIDNINALLTVNGGNGTDALNVDDSNPAATGKSGTLTSSTLRGLGLEQGIDFGQFETFNIWLDAGSNTFDIMSTVGSGTTVNTADGNDTVNINGASATLTVNAEAGADTINVAGTGAGSQTFINTHSGDDIINVRAIGGPATVNAGDGADTVNVGSNAAGTIGDPSNNSDGTVDSIAALLTIDGMAASTC
jgi:hypothetical protein